MSEVTKVELVFTGMIPGDDDIAIAMRSVATDIEKGMTEGSEKGFEDDAWKLTWKTWIV